MTSLIIFFGIVVALLLGRAYADHLGTEAWRAFAEEHELDCHLADGASAREHAREVRGSYRGHQIQLYTVERKGAGRARGMELTYSVYKILLPDSVPSDLRIGYETFSDQVGKLVGRQDIEIDREKLDDKLLIQGDSPEEIRELLDREAVEEAFVELCREWSDNFGIKNRTLRLEHWGLKLSRGAIEEVFDQMIHCTDQMHRSEQSESGAASEMEW